MTSDCVISVDVMGADKGPSAMIAGLNRAVKVDPSLRFILHGDETQVMRFVNRKRHLRGKVDIRHTDDVVKMDDRPSRAMRSGKNTSMWRALQSVADGEARVALSAGNTGAVVAMAMLALRRAPGVRRPAIAVHWPARIDHGYNVVLDMGADIRADAASLAQYAIMGAEYSRVAFGIERPRVGLLNVGSEETKGPHELHDAKDLLETLGGNQDLGFTFVGYVEGNDITRDRADVIVTDGFTGNVAMKAAEGTASLISQALHAAFTHSILSKIGSLFALTSLRRLRLRIDPRRVNGGVFLGLNGAVVKSHGGADAVGHASAVGLAAKLATDDFSNLVARRLAKLDAEGISQRPSGESGVGGK